MNKQKNIRRFRATDENEGIDSKRRQRARREIVKERKKMIIKALTRPHAYATVSGWR